ncbi:hypothetical protein [Candidatus Williamhamiltonella defendens]|uniref:hypothetical protein n=1 Tax=Candidatus Williamhamiltonella defendens TaxID=138072 RepID=UPI00130EF8AD|nr:hypothetical protein [Candidatus Hamiltonella defensa]
MIVHAGDPDDEGQLLVDELLEYTDNCKPVKRLLINDNTDAAVKNAMSQLKDNQQFKGIYRKALALACCQFDLWPEHDLCICHQWTTTIALPATVMPMHSRDIRLRGKKADIKSASVQEKASAPPIPFNLVRLQQTINYQHKMTAARTLEIT